MTDTTIVDDFGKFLLDGWTPPPGLQTVWLGVVPPDEKAARQTSTANAGRIKIKDDGTNMGIAAYHQDMHYILLVVQVSVAGVSPLLLLPVLQSFHHIGNSYTLPCLQWNRARNEKVRLTAYDSLGKMEPPKWAWDYVVNSMGWPTNQMQDRRWGDCTHQADGWTCGWRCMAGTIDLLRKVRRTERRWCFACAASNSV